MLSICILSFLVLFINYKLDTFNLFGSNKNDSIVLDLKNNYYVSSPTITSNRVENLYDKLLYLKKNDTIDFLAIGSSRTVLLHKKDIFDNLNINYLNFTDGTANLNHYAKVIGLFNKYSIPIPKTIIIGLDPWVFDLKVSMAKIKKLLNADFKYSNNKYAQLFNYEYTKINLLSLLKKEIYLKSQDISSLYSADNPNMIVSPDGDLYYPKTREEKSFKLVNESIQSRLKQCINNIHYNTKCINYKTLQNIEQFSYFVKYLQGKGSRVIIYLPPFAPTFYQHIVTKNGFEKSFNIIMELLKRLNVNRVIGSYDPKDLNLDDKDFLDAIHHRNSAVEKIFKDVKIDKL